MDFFVNEKVFRSEVKRTLQGVCAEYGVEFTKEDERVLQQIQPFEFGGLLVRPLRRIALDGSEDGMAFKA